MNLIGQRCAIVEKLHKGGEFMIATLRPEIGTQLS
jgi:hypothetical protein